MDIFKYFIFNGMLAFIVNAVPCWANDSTSGEENGSIVLTRQPNISMDKETLLISEEEVQVEYIFTNTSKTDIQVPVTFPMPPIYLGLSDHSTIENFKLWIDGEPKNVNYRLSVKLDNGIDISNKLADLGWSAEDVVAFVQEEKPPEHKPALPKNWFEKNGMPKFTMSNYFTWTQLFPAGKPITVRHVYAPSKSSSIPQSSAILLHDFSKSTCIDSRTQAGMKKREGANGLNWSYLSYILLTANNWQGPIKEFDLTIKKKDAADLMSLCFKGELKKIDPITFKFHALNFTPTENINILFIGKKF